jgi:hypothetical protein
MKDGYVFGTALVVELVSTPVACFASGWVSCTAEGLMASAVVASVAYAMWRGLQEGLLLD